MSEPNVITLSGLERRLGIVRKEPRSCATHGEYQAVGRRDGDDLVWSDCPRCSDERRTRQEAEERARDARERQSRMIEGMLGQAAIPPRYVGLTFDTYRVQDGNRRQAHNLQACMEYAAAFPDRRAAGEGLLLMGLKGTGKTHLACAIAQNVIHQHGKTAVYTIATRMFRRLKATFNRDSQETEDQVIAMYARPDLLIIDEIGMGHCSPTELGHLFEIVNERYENRRPTMIITNIGAAPELEAWVGERTMDRLREAGKALLFDWPSWRGQLQK